MAYLEIETRDGTHRIQLERDRLSLGRLSYNDVVLPFAQVSRQHAELRLIAGRWWITDLQSTNGLRIGERRIQEHCLADGDHITLAPGISVRFVDDRFPAPGAGQPAMGDTDTSSGSWAQRVREQFSPAAFGGAAGPAVPPGRTWGPAPNVPPATPWGPFVPPSSVAPLRPRSMYSDDEVPYVPPGMEPPYTPGLSLPRQPASPPAGPDVTRSVGPASSPPGGAGGNPFPPAPPPLPPADATRSSGGYPAPPGPFRAGSDPHDPFMRDAPAGERQRSPSGPASTLLHVCQTCGQLTAPDSVYCQNCHHSIAHECANCRLSLLPIQDRCPRCHTPNAASVRRAHPGRNDS